MSVNRIIGVLWLGYCMTLTFSLSGMEIISTLLLPFVFYSLFKRRYELNRWQKVFLWLVGLNICGWLISVTLNQATSVQMPRDIEALRRFFFILFPLLIWTQMDQKFPAKETMMALAAGFVFSLFVGLYLRDWTGDMRYSGGFSWAITYGVIASTLMYVTLYLWAETGFRYKKYVVVLLAFVLMTVFFSKTRSAWGALVLGGIVFSFISLKRVKHQVAAALGAVLFVLALLQVPMVKNRLFMKKDISLEQRKIFAEMGLKMGMDYFPWGVGYKNPPRVLQLYTAKIGRPELAHAHAHNHWIETFAGTGVFSLLAWVGMFGLPLFYFARKFFRRDLTFQDRILIAGFFHLLGLTMFEVIAQDGEMSHTTFFFFGIVFLHWSQDSLRAKIKSSSPVVPS